MKSIYYVCAMVLCVTLIVVAIKCVSALSAPKPLSPEEAQLVRSKFSESCAFASRSDWDSTRRALEEVLRVDPGQPIALYDLSVLSDLKGDTTQTTVLLKKALKRAATAKVNKIAVSVVREGVLVGLLLPEDAETSRLKFPSNEEGANAVYKNGESVVVFTDGQVDLRRAIQTYLKTLDGPKPEVSKFDGRLPDGVMCVWDQTTSNWVFTAVWNRPTNNER